MVVSADDRHRWERQVAALELIENSDEGTPDARAAVIESVNDRRRAHQRPELATEGELHRRARALGLLECDGLRRTAAE